MFNWFKKPEIAQPKTPKVRKSLFSTHAMDELPSEKQNYQVLDKLSELKRKQPIFNSEYAMDDSSNGFPSFKTYDAGTNSVSDGVVFWYSSQGFIGAQLCGIVAQNWLVNKACAMPGDDAIRKGYNVVSVDGEELDPEAVKIIKSYDKSFRVNFNMREFIRKGRIFGVRIAMFKVMSTDPDYYEKPFNIDGVTAGSYKGIVQVDPYWTAPMLDQASASQPDTLHFYEPTHWIINGKKIHRSHLIIFRHAEPIDILKPQYLYGGIPLSQQIMERVYAAERTANEAPQLAMSKRTTVWLTDMEAVMQDTNAAVSRLQQWAQFRDNYGIKMGDKEGDEFQQFDTSLSDFDALIMTQYQLVAAIAGVPATKLIGTTPKGFNSTGEYEEASYHELLESIQTHDLTPFLERHHQLVIKSYVEPQLKVKINLETTVNWLPLDTPTAQELAATNLAKAQAGQVLLAAGAISSEEERQRIATDKTSGYNEIGIDENDMPEVDDLESDDEISGSETEEDGEPQPPKSSGGQDAATWHENDHPRADNGQFGSGTSAANTNPVGKATSQIEAPASSTALTEKPKAPVEKPKSPKTKEKKQEVATEPPKPPTAKSSAQHLEGVINQKDLDQLPPEKQKELMDIYEKAAANKNKFDKTNYEIAQELGGEAAEVGIKSTKRAIEKVIEDYDGDPSQLKDLLRTTISINTLNDTNKAIDAIKAKYGEPIKLKNTLDPSTNSVNGSGYRDVNMVFKMDGSYIEVQVNMKPMLDVKYGEGHKIYEEVREMEGKAKKEKRSLTKDEVNRITKLNARSKQLYSAAWEEMTA